VRALFSIVGLLVVVAIVLMLGRNQFSALGFGVGARPAADSAAAARSNASAAVPEQARNIEQKVQSELQRALDAGMQQRASEPGQ
jgi:hypothetical protein